MKTENNISKGLILTILFITMSSMLFSQTPNRPDHPGRMMHMQAPPAPPQPPAPPSASLMEIPGAPAQPQLDLPGLTNEQQDKISQADIDHMRAITPLQNLIREKKAHLQTILTTSPFDGKAADQVAEDLGKTETTILKEVIRHDQELRNLLTPRQQVIFDSRPKPFLHRER
ncbi:MAG: periplasmic heavy metal sensor [Bacteroidota bacterium]